jgi:YVTN family beta-propeller protein
MKHLLPLVCHVVTAAILIAQTPERPVRAVTDPGTVTTRQAIAPAGVPTVFQGKIYGVAFGRTSDEVWVLHTSSVYRLDWKNNKVAGRWPLGGGAAPQGVIFHNGRALISSTMKGGKVQLLEVTEKLVPVADNLGSTFSGAPGAAGNVIVVPLAFENKLAVLRDGKLTGTLPTGIAPFAAVTDGETAFVSNWGGRLSKPNERTAPTGLKPDADRVVIDERGVAATGTLTRIDLRAMKPAGTISVGLHPTAMAWDTKRSRLYVANNNSDTVSVVNTQTNQVVSTIAIQPFPRAVAGVAPMGVAVSPDGRKLYVACGGINAIVVVDTASGKLTGSIPTAWYPNGLAISEDGKRLAVSALLGVGSGWRDEPRQRYVHAYRGSVHVIETPDDAQLANYTTAVLENNHMTAKAEPAAQPAKTPVPIPVRSGDPSTIEHVVYIIKENRTYDQVFGAMPKGNGDPSLVMFGEDVTPNHQRLADQFVLLDNFYATGGNSGDGHQWVTQANEVAYTLWPGYVGRSYPFDGSDPIAYSRSGFIWDLATARNKSVRVYGEYAPRAPEPASAREPMLKRWEKGEDFTSEFKASSPIPGLDKVLVRNFPTYTNSIPDVVRAQIFLADLKKWNEAGSMPNLTIIQLPCDHTFGTRPDVSTPKAMVADNDLALGQIVEALSASKFWPKMAIFVVEDDAQNGVDHVDGHRTVALAISPYIRRGHVDSTFYSHQSMLKTIELILGLPTMSLFDLIAHDMRNSFTAQPDFTAYKSVVPKQSLWEKNPPLSALRGPARQAAIDSEKMRWDVPDAVPTERLNRILWGQIRGWNTPYPGARTGVFAPLSLDIDDDER